MSSNVSRVIKSRTLRWAGHVAGMGGRGVCRILVGKHEGTSVLVRPRSKWEENIKIVHQNVECGVNWISLTQDRDRGRTLVHVEISFQVT